MKPQRIILGLVLCGALIHSGVGPAFARTDIEPRVFLREEYNDNIFLEADQEEDDYITTVNPGIHLTFDTKALTANVDYQLEFRFYQEHTEENQTSIADAQRLASQLRLYPEEDFTLTAEDVYSRVVIDERRPTSESNPAVNRANLNRLEINPRYRLRRWKTLEPGLSYRYRNLNYDEKEGNDSSSHRLDADLVKHLSATFRIKARIGGEASRANDASDYDRLDGVAGFEAEPAARFSLGGEAGKSWIDFREAGSNAKGALWNFWTAYQLAPRVSSRLEYAQDFAESVDQGLVKNQTARCSLTYVGDRHRGEAALLAGRAAYQETDRRDDSAGGQVSATLAFGEHWTFGLNGFWTFYRFDDGNGVEDVERFGGDGRLGYSLRILSLGAGWRHEEGDSERPENDYRNNIAYVDAQLTF